MSKAIFLLITVFIVIGYMVVVYGGFEVDRYVSSHIHLIYNDTLTLVAKTLSFIGGMKESLFLSSIFLVWLYTKRYLHEMKLYIYSLISSIALFAFIKHIVARPRPHSILVEAHNYSFPSGHSTMAMAMALGVYFVYKDKVKHPNVILVIAILWAVCMALSRVYLNVHYISDITAGLMLGAICALIAKVVVSNKKSL